MLRGLECFIVLGFRMFNCSWVQNVLLFRSLECFFCSGVQNVLLFRGSECFTVQGFRMLYCSRVQSVLLFRGSEVVLFRGLECCIVQGSRLDCCHLWNRIKERRISQPGKINSYCRRSICQYRLPSSQTYQVGRPSLTY